MQLSLDTFDNADVERDSRERMIIPRGQHLPPCRSRTHNKQRSAVRLSELGIGSDSAQVALGDAWLIEEGIPSRAAQKEQLKLMRRRNQPGDEQSANKSVKQSQDKARVAFSELQGQCRGGGSEYGHLIGNGTGSSDWRDMLLKGEEVPTPFLTHGRVGRNPAASLSAVREYLLLRQQGVALKAPNWDREHPHAGITDRGVVSEQCSKQTIRSAQQKQQCAVTFVDNLCVHVKDMHQRAAARRKDFVRRLEEGDFVKGMDFWSGIRHQLCDNRCETIQHIVEESKLANNFKPLKSGAQKGDTIARTTPLFLPPC